MVLWFKKYKIYHYYGITLIDGQIIREVKSDRYKYVGIIELDRIEEQGWAKDEVTVYQII